MKTRVNALLLSGEPEATPTSELIQDADQDDDADGDNHDPSDLAEGLWQRKLLQQPPQENPNDDQDHQVHD